MGKKKLSTTHRTKHPMTLAVAAYACGSCVMRSFVNSPGFTTSSSKRPLQNGNLGFGGCKLSNLDEYMAPRMYDYICLSEDFFIHFPKHHCSKFCFFKLLAKARPGPGTPKGPGSTISDMIRRTVSSPDSSPNPLLCLAAGQAAEVQNFIHTSGVWYPASSYYPPSGVYIGSN